MNIICSQGDHALGGVDFDRKVLELLEKSYRDKFGAELIGSDEDRAKYEDEAEGYQEDIVAAQRCQDHALRAGGQYARGNNA